MTCYRDLVNERSVRGIAVLVIRAVTGSRNGTAASPLASRRSSRLGALWCRAAHDDSVHLSAHWTLFRKRRALNEEDEMTTTQIFGIVGTGLVIVGYIPQIVHLIKERCTAGISIAAFSLWCAASLLFLMHAAVIRDAVFVAVQTVNLVAGGLIVVFCKRYEGQVCPFHRAKYSGGAKVPH